MCAYERIGSPPTRAMITRTEEQGEDDAASVIDGRQPARGVGPRLERAVHGFVADPPAAAGAGTPAACPATGHQQPDLVDVGVGGARTSRRSGPRTCTSIPIGQGQDLVELLGDEQDRGPRLAPLEEEPMDGLDRADIEAAGRLDGDHQPRAGFDLAGEDQALEVAARQQPRLACRSTARRSRTASLRPSASARAAVSSMNQPRATGGVSIALHDQVVGDRQVGRAADPGPILGNVGDAVPDGVRRPAGW